MEFDLTDLFEYHAPTPEQTEHIKAVRASMKATCAVIVDHIPDSAMRTLAIRKLEESSMWANKAIVFTEG